MIYMWYKLNYELLSKHQSKVINDIYVTQIKLWTFIQTWAIKINFLVLMATIKTKKINNPQKFLPFYQLAMACNYTPIARVAFSVICLYSCTCVYNRREVFAATLSLWQYTYLLGFSVPQQYTSLTGYMMKPSIIL